MTRQIRNEFTFVSRLLLTALVPLACAKTGSMSVESTAAAATAAAPPMAPPPAAPIPQVPESLSQPSTTRIGTSSLLALIGRHPEIYANSQFKEWLRSNRVSRWYESAFDADSQRTVVIESDNVGTLFAASVGLGGSVQIARSIEASPTIPSRMAAYQSAQTFDAVQPLKELRGLRPVVTFIGPATVVRWEAEYKSLTPDRQGWTKELYWVDPKGTLQLFKDSTAKPVPPAKPPSPSDDYLASNELHHVDAFKAEALAWTKGLTTVAQKARRIHEQVAKSYHYDETIVAIADFTWSDLLTRDVNSRGGVCDEFSVISITYLRALGIPARLKFMAFVIPGVAGQQSHAAVEYLDGGVWKHFDALWAFNDPGIYRKRAGAQDVTVFDADEPSDARSTGPSFSYQDPTGDGLLNPFADFIYRPKAGYPGEKRAGYSY